jgi:glycosyltransferase involved in cell wall biosynthesis
MKINKIISVIIPVYNSEKTLTDLHDRLKQVLSTVTTHYEIIFVDDSSSDDSWLILKKIHQNDDRVRIIHLQQNYGQQNATLCGFNYAKGDYIITIDDDLQHPPEEIPKLINKIHEGYSVVYGKYAIKQHSRIENFFSKQLQFLIRTILDLPQGLRTSSFAIYTSTVIKNVVNIKSSYVFLSALVGKSVSSYKIVNVDVVHHPRRSGKSNYNIIKYLKLGLNLIINYSTLPLLIVGFLGIFTAIISFCYGSYIILRYFTDPTFGIVGWGSMMVVLTFLGGIILLSIAIIGEYLRRILTEVSYGQQYVVDEMED